MKEYKVLDLSYSQDARQHLKDVRAYHELDGWRLLTVVHLEASGRWLYYLERDAEPGAQAGVAATAVGSEQGLPGPVRRVEGGSGEVVATGADVTAEGVSAKTMRWPDAGQESRLSPAYMPATWRCTTPVDGATGRVGLALNVAGGHGAVRVALDLDSALDLVATLAEALSAHRHRSAASGGAGPSPT